MEEKIAQKNIELPQKVPSNKFITKVRGIKNSILVHKKPITLSVITCFITLILVITGYSYNLNSKQYMLSPVSIRPEGSGSFPKSFALNTNLKDVKNLGILLLGRGGAGHDGGYLTDAIQLLYIDFEKGQASLISIPRDIWVKLPNNKEGKINIAFNENPEYAKTVVNEITGLPVNYYIVIDFVGLMRTVGIELDGIEVNVAEALDDPWYPISGEENNTCDYTPEEIEELHQKYSGFELERQFKCRFEHLRFEPGINQMDGGKALKYTRSRHGSGAGDVSRGKRQQEVLVAMKNKIFSLETIDNIPALYQALVQHVQTDISLDIAQYLSPIINNSKDFKLLTINLGPSNVLAASTSTGGGAIFIPKEGNGKWENTKNFISEQINTD